MTDEELKPFLGKLAKINFNVCGNVTGVIVGKIGEQYRIVPPRGKDTFYMSNCTSMEMYAASITKVELLEDHGQTEAQRTAERQRELLKEVEKWKMAVTFCLDSQIHIPADFVERYNAAIGALKEADYNGNQAES